MLSSPLWAATETLVVTASGEAGGQQNTVAPYINSATKSAVPETRTPQTVDSISQQQIGMRHGNSLNEILRYDAGWLPNCAAPLPI